MIVIDLSKQQALDTDPNAIQQINFTGANNRVMFFITEEAKETILDFSLGTVKVLWSYFTLKYQYKMTQYNALNVKLSHSQLNK